MEPLPPIDDLAFSIRESFSSVDDLMSDGGSFSDSPPSSISSDINECRSSTDSELQRHDSITSYPGRSSGLFFKIIFASVTLIFNKSVR